MGRQLAISAAAMVAVSGLFCSISAAQVKPADPATPELQPAQEETQIPVKQVVLFNSGVGYFEHGGTVKGDAITELHFKTEQINDILKSLLLQDTDGGTVGTVSYPGLAPLARTLKSFAVDITANPEMADLLNQLRGAKLMVTTIEPGAQKLTGVIMGVERKMHAVGDKSTVEIVQLNLKVDRKFISVDLDLIQSMELEDARLQKELDDALATLAKSRDQDKKPMTLHFNGKGERHVRIGYLVETPVWKTSYRLVLGTGEAEKKHGPAGDAAPATAPANPPATQPAGLHAGAKIQGWAIVENQTDNDWADVQLSLVSGRPLSFIQDLYHSQYLPRPVVESENYLSLRPQTYAGGTYGIKDLATNIPDFSDAPDFSLNSGGNGGGGQQNAAQGGGQQGSLFAGGDAKMANRGGNGGGNGQQQQAPIDPTASILSAATASRVGELFKYRLGKVSLARQTSAMIPIVTDDIDAERVSIYNASTFPAHPLLGARVKNNTGKFLLQGPVTVLDHGSYAGDARLDDLPPGQERLLSFGIDQQLLVDPSADYKSDSTTVGAKIAKGFLTVTSRTVNEQTYLADNKSDETRVLVIEHPRVAAYKLLSPAKAEEATADLYRFRRSIPAHQAAKFTVITEMVFDTPAQINQLKPENFAAYLTDVAIPQKVRGALLKASQLKDQVLAVNAKISNLNRESDELTTDQARIRENLKAVAADSEFSKRLVKKIDGEESELEKRQKALIDLHTARDAAEKQLTDYIAGLTVE